MRPETGYDGAVGRPKTAVPQSAQFGFRSSEEVRRRFEAWLAKENAGRIIPVSEADALRLLVTWAGMTMPSLDDLNRAPLPADASPLGGHGPDEEEGGRLVEYEPGQGPKKRAR